MKLFQFILEATPKGRNTEQHDAFFGIAENIKDLVPYIIESWPKAKGKIHLDGFKEVRFVDGFEVKILPKTNVAQENKLFFINLGGYKRGFFAEFHEQHLMVGTSLSDVTKKVKQTEFYKTMSFQKATSHIDDKYGVDIDDIYKVQDIIPEDMKAKYSIILEKSAETDQQNFFEVGYFQLHKL